MIKIKNIEITGIRGIKKTIVLEMAGSHSFLLYGDNGSGKSSITDALEWFFYNRVDHLSSKEIGKDWVEALRNLFLSTSDKSFVDIKLSNIIFDANRILSYKGTKVISDYSNANQEFKDYIVSSKKERLILRYKDLLKFILFTKSERLIEIEDIIGYSEVKKVKDTLKRATSDLKREIKSSNFENQKNDKQALFLRDAGRNIYDDSHYFEAINKLIAPLNISINVNGHDKIKELMNLLQTADNKESIALLVSYNKLVNDLPLIVQAIKKTKEEYKNYYDEYFKIAKDIEKIKKIQLEKLLAEGLSLLESKGYANDKCPLCLQDKKREELIGELRKRIAELSVIKKEKQKIEEIYETVQKNLQDVANMTEILFREKCVSIEPDIKTCLELAGKNVAEFSAKIKKQLVTEIQEIIKPGEIKFIDDNKVCDIIADITKKIKILTEKNRDDLRVKISSQITLIIQAYSEFCILKKKEELLNQQQRSMELISEYFIKKQKEALNIFLQSISKDMNEFYLYMNKTEKVDEIELILIGEADELEGITMQYKFHGKIVSPPDKYLSESHLNCLGIALFLSSVKKFNKTNGFFVMDDVISSFDKPHRIAFSRLLIEKFNDYQIFLFTHELDWYEMLAEMVKPKNWNIKRIFYTDENGSEIEMFLPELKERIECKFKKSDQSDLGNMIRKYLERLLKEICLNLEVKVKFLFNDRNEKRMPAELISEIKSKLKNRKCEIKDNPVIENITKSDVLCNWTSHDSSYTESIDDFKTLYNDILQFEATFICSSSKCGKPISTKYLDTVNDLIRCSCGKLSYNWKE